MLKRASTVPALAEWYVLHLNGCGGHKAEPGSSAVSGPHHYTGGHLGLRI